MTFAMCFDTGMLVGVLFFLLLVVVVVGTSIVFVAVTLLKWADVWRGRLAANER
jgi:hypothetical protein